MFGPLCKALQVLDLTPVLFDLYSCMLYFLGFSVVLISYVPHLTLSELSFC